MKVNFEVVSIDKKTGIAMVKYWADGATEAAFGKDIGPYKIQIRPEVDTMTYPELKAHIAKWGKAIVQKQIDVLAVNSENNTSSTKFQNIVGTPLFADIA